MDIDVEPTERPDDDSDGDTGDDGGPAEIEVEVTDPETATTERADLPRGIDAPEYVLYGGKGGVGKTTMAAATALASAADGTATLVVSTDPAHSLSDTLGVSVPAEPTRLDEDMPLYAAEIDPDSVMEGPFADSGMGDAAGAGGAGGTGAAGGAGAADETEYDTSEYDADNPFVGNGDASNSPFGGMGDAMGGFEDMLGGDGPLGMGGPMPGADEAAAMQQLLEYLDDPRFDRVVIDTAPTGHTLRLLELPEIMDSMLGRIVRMRDKFSGMMDNIKGMFGGGPDEPQAGMADLDDLRERIERLRAILRDPAKTDFRVVMIPEEMSVVESNRLVSRLDEFGIPVQTLVVNRVMEPVDDVADVDSRWFVSPDLDDCSFCQRRWDVQQQALRSATDLFRGRDVKRVPLLADQVQGEDALRVVAACLD
ncbi:ArsA family ATPase [Haloferax larsenii]|uniref:Arsenite efflux ATP-binding protein ArsA n=1 Tax=Haloferax larsenii TaxID=302484 RepID=A0A1H7GTC3_HALLR|nr:TRC40/GET3/ArsA family transport-energizing ATPase [Haloferax larsenii]SEK39115.1 arsenite efflux ATP-binding protein ArsA [Haloferax larsenii]